MLHPDSLRGRLVWRLSGLLSLIVLLGGALTFALAVHFANRVFDQWLFDSASTLGAQVKATPGEMRVDLPRSALEMFEFDTVDRVFYDVVTADGRRIFGNAALPPPQALEPGGGPTFYNASLLGKPVRAVSIRAQAPQSESGTVSVQVAETTNKRDTLVVQILLSSLVPQFALLLLAGLAIWYAVKSAMQRLDQITAQIGGYRPDGHYPLPDPASAPAEVRPLLLALHDLVGKLAEAQKSQRRFIANASHQLRTPLAALQVQAERALREPDPVKHSSALRSVLKTLTRLRHLANQLLMLSRAEPADNADLRLRPVDLAVLAREELGQWTEAAIEAASDLGYEGPVSGLSVNGEPELLHELLGNLVDNAIRYGGSGARITVGLDAGPPVQLIVDDDGPGVPESERSMVLERFYRRAHERAGGAGLGLAIAHEIAARHGAKLVIETPPGGQGTRVAVTFADGAP